MGRRTSRNLSANPTVSLPEVFPATELALLTRAGFLALRNPDNKYHESGAYSSNLKSLNQSDANQVGSVENRQRRKLSVFATNRDDGSLIFRDSDHKTVAVLHDGTLYRNRSQQIPHWYVNNRTRDGVNLRVVTEKEVKYPAEYEHLVDDVIANNRAKYPILLQRALVGGEKLEIRSEIPPRPDHLDTVVFLNRDGLVVAMGSNEWGATLLRTADEYRGKGVGRAIATLWYELNPNSLSGGFTAAGRATALATWEAHVRGFLSRGWYSELVRQRRLTHGQVDAILAGLSGKRRADPREPAEESDPDLRVYVDDNIVFILYDARFLEEPDEKYVYGYGFLRDSSAHGTYFYRIEHDKKYRQLVSSIGLQMAHDGGEKIYVAESPGDLLEWQDVPHVKHADGYVSLTKDILPLKKLSAEERRARRKVDSYDELKNSLLEIADSKWS